MNPTSLLESSQNIPFLVEKCDEYNAEILKIQFKLMTLETRLKSITEDSELLVVFVKGAILNKPSKHKFNVSVMQPVPEEDSFIDPDLNPVQKPHSTYYVDRR